MLGSLTGTVSGRIGQRILIEVHHTPTSAVGYWVFTGAWQPSGSVTCYLYHHVREEASDLYGFPTIPTLELFEQLLTVSGIGPKAALAILSLGEASRIQQAIASSDVAFLTLAPGVGRKAAEKILVELKGKAMINLGDSPTQNLHTDLQLALEGLGYKMADIAPILGTIPSEIDTLDAQLKWVLKEMTR